MDDGFDTLTLREPRGLKMNILVINVSMLQLIQTH